MWTVEPRKATHSRFIPLEPSEAQNKKTTEFDKETGSGKREEGPVDALRIWNETSTVNGWQKIP